MATLVDAQEEINGLKDREGKWMQNEATLRAELRALHQRISEFESLLKCAEAKNEEISKSGNEMANRRVFELEAENKVIYNYHVVYEPRILRVLIRFFLKLWKLWKSRLWIWSSRFTREACRRTGLNLWGLVMLQHLYLPPPLLEQVELLLVH